MSENDTVRIRLYFCIGDYDDSIVIEGDGHDEVEKKMDAELSRRGATWTGVEILEGA